MASEPKRVRRLFRELLANHRLEFPRKGGVPDVPEHQGVYVIRFQTKVLHVGRTYRGKKGLKQRLDNHLYSQSSFTEKYLKDGSKLRRPGYTFQYLEVDGRGRRSSSRLRALLEFYATASLCPAHLGSHLAEEMTV